jgi:hypothetical protein
LAHNFERARARRAPVETIPGLSELTMVDPQKEAEKEKEADVEEMAGEGTHDHSLEPAALADRTPAAVEENVGSEGKEGEQVEKASQNHQMQSTKTSF